MYNKDKLDLLCEWKIEIFKNQILLCMKQIFQTGIFLFAILEILENLKLIEEDCLYLEDKVECAVECKSFYITLFTILFEDSREKNLKKFF